jgi:carbonic anhydrase
VSQYHQAPPLPARRRFLALAGMAALGIAWPGLPGSAWARPVTRRAIEPDTPEAALRMLMEGNARFAAGQLTAPHRNLERLNEVAAAQHPFAAVLSCADSRVPVELLFDQGFGDLFVVRNAGNVVTPEEIASLEFGALVLGAKVLMVLGHSQCGAVKAAIAGDAVPGQISTLFQHIQPAVDAAGPDIGAVVEANVRHQAHLLERASPVLATLVRERKLLVVGGVYDLASRRVKEVTR